LRLVSTVPCEVAQASRKLGERLRLARIRRRMTQEELAAACGITRKTLDAIKKGSAPRWTIRSGPLLGPSAKRQSSTVGLEEPEHELLCILVSSAS